MGKLCAITTAVIGLVLFGLYKLLFGKVITNKGIVDFTSKWSTILIIPLVALIQFFIPF